MLSVRQLDKGIDGETKMLRRTDGIGFVEISTLFRQTVVKNCVKCTSGGILSPIIATPWFKHEGLGSHGRMESTVTMKTTFVKVKYMSELSYSSREGAAIVNEAENPL
jgi:hypothetical protein